MESFKQAAGRPSSAELRANADNLPSVIIIIAIVVVVVIIIVLQDDGEGTVLLLVSTEYKLIYNSHASPLS